MNFREWHHGYLGAMMVGVGLLVRAPWCWGLGMYLVLDDTAQHALGWPSPAKWLYGKTLYRIPFVRAANTWLDRLFGK